MNSCGTSGHKGHWDYCKQSPMQEFENQNYQQKTEQIWARVTDPSKVGKSVPAVLAAHTLATLVKLSVISTFDNQHEVLETGRERVIHAQGVMCQVDMKVNSNSPFTGVLQPGTQSGMMRLGSAASLDEPFAGRIFPGFGLKFLRSGVLSADWVSLRSAGDAEGYDFFESAFSNHVIPQAVLVKLNKFQQASGCIDMVGVSDACTYTQDGKKVANPEFPFEVIFEPTGKVNFQNEKKSNDALLKELSGIADGSEILTVYAFASPKDKKQGNRIELGTVTTTGSCHQSLFGDQELFFRHQRMEEDFAQRPEWIQQMELLGDPVCEATPGPVSQWQCPHLAAQSMTV